MKIDPKELGGAIAFKLNGKDITAFGDETIIQTAKRHGVEIPHLCYKEGMRPDGNCRACMVEIKGERVLAPSCCRNPQPGMEVTSDSARAVHSQKMVLELLLSDMPAERLHARFRARRTGRARSTLGKPRFAPRESPAADLSHPAIAVNLDSCIQCTRCVRACREEQVNDVIGYAFRGEHSKIVFDLDDPMGAEHLRRLRRMRAGVPDRRADARARRRAGAARQDGGFGLPVLRRRLPAHLLHQGQQDPPRRRPRRPGEPRAAVRQGPLRLRLRAPQAAAHQAADPQAGRAEARRLHDGSRPLGRSLPRSDLGRSARSGGGQAARASRHARSAGACRASARPKAATRKRTCSRSSCAPAFGTNNVDHCTRLCHASSVAALLEGIGSGAVSNQVIDVLQGRSRAPDRRQSRRQPSGGGDVDQERGQERHQADHRRPAPLRARAPRDVLPAVQARHRRGAAERDDAHDRPRRPGQRGVRREPHQRLRGAEARTSQDYSPEAMAPVCGIAAETIKRSRAPLRDVEGLDDPVGHGHFAAHPRHRQRALPDRAVA